MIWPSRGQGRRWWWITVILFVWKQWHFILRQHWLVANDDVTARIYLTSKRSWKTCSLLNLLEVWKEPTLAPERWRIWDGAEFMNSVERSVNIQVLKYDQSINQWISVSFIGHLRLISWLIIIINFSSSSCTRYSTEDLWTPLVDLCRPFRRFAAWISERRSCCAASRLRQIVNAAWNSAAVISLSNDLTVPGLMMHGVRWK